MLQKLTLPKSVNAFQFHKKPTSQKRPKRFSWLKTGARSCADVTIALNCTTTKTCHSWSTKRTRFIITNLKPKTKVPFLHFDFPLCVNCVIFDKLSIFFPRFSVRKRNGGSFSYGSCQASGGHSKLQFNEGQPYGVLEEICTKWKSCPRRRCQRVLWANEVRQTTSSWNTR